MSNASNRRRWAVDQHKQARVRAAETLPSVERVQEAELEGLLNLAQSLEMFPHMAELRSTILAKIETIQKGLNK